MTNDRFNRGAPYRELFQLREFRALYIAQSLSIVGDQLSRIAVASLIYTRTGSSFLTSISYAASYLPWLIGGPTLSVIADRVPRRQVMIVCDGVRVPLMAIVSIKTLPTPLVLVLVTASALAQPPFMSARAALVPEIVGTDSRYTAAATVGSVTSQIAVVAGFVAGGVLTALLGVSSAILVDAATFALSSVVLYTSVAKRAPAHHSRGPWLGDMRKGATLVFGDTRLRNLVITSWIVVGTVVATEALAVPYARLHDRGAASAGALTASLPAGIVVGTLFLGRVDRSRDTERAIPYVARCVPLTLAASMLNTGVALTAVLWFVVGALSAVTVLANRLFVVAVPNAARSRAFGVAAAGISGSQGLGSLLAGCLATVISPADSLGVVAGCALLLLTFTSLVERRGERFGATRPSSRSPEPVGDLSLYSQP